MAYHKSQDHKFTNVAVSTSTKGVFSATSQLDQQTSRVLDVADSRAEEFKCVLGEGRNLIKCMNTASEKMCEAMEKSSKILSRAMIVTKAKDIDQAKEWLKFLE